jgi:two-component sensor histidine kinase
MAATDPTAPNHPPFRDVVDHLPAALYVTDLEGAVVFYNHALVELTGSEPRLGSKQWPEQLAMFLPDGTPLPVASSAMGQAHRNQSAAGPMEILVQKLNSVRIPLLALAAPLRDPSGAISGTVNLLVDIANRKEAEAESRALLHQFVHNEKNEIQTIQSLLAGAQREADSAEAKEVLTDTARRVGAIAVAQSAIDRAAGVFEARVLIENLGRHLGQSFGAKLDLHTDASVASLPNRSALPLAIIVNELVALSVAHGHGDCNRAAVHVVLTGAGDGHLLTVSHDGAGTSPDAPKRRASGLGLVEGLARQLGGSVEVVSDHGTRYVVRFSNGAI